MSSMLLGFNTKVQIENVLSTLIGSPIRKIRRSAFMLGVDYGDDVEYTDLTGSKRGQVRMVPQYSIHVHSSWRILKNNDICLGQSDLSRKFEGFKSHENNDEVFDREEVFTEASKELNEIFRAGTIKVIRIEASSFGDLKIYMENGYCLELFVDSVGATESWRFFSMDDDSCHFVVFDECDNGTI